MLKRKKCNYDNCDNPAWSEGFCKNHSSPSKAMKSTRMISTVDKMKPLQRKNNERQAMYELFMILWKKRGNKSEVSGETIYGEPSSAHFHHILPKFKYPEAKMDEENIIIMTMDEHDTVEKDMYRYVEVSRRRETLMRKYDLI